MTYNKCQSDCKSFIGINCYILRLDWCYVKLKLALLPKEPCVATLCSSINSSALPTLSAKYSTVQWDGNSSPAMAWLVQIYMQTEGSCVWKYNWFSRVCGSEFFAINISHVTFVLEWRSNQIFPRIFQHAQRCPGNVAAAMQLQVTDGVSAVSSTLFDSYFYQT